MRIIISTNCDILYTCFYITGLLELFGNQNVSFSERPFGQLGDIGKNIAFLSEVDGEVCRYYISCDDFSKINEKAYEWCDVYGSVNANYSLTDKKYHEKLVVLCPSFGIRCWSPLETVRHALIDYRPAFGSFRKFLGKHKRLLATRRTLDDYYLPAENTRNEPYIFFCSTLWYNDEWNKNDEGMNMTRARFIRACKEIDGVTFEGGLVPQSNGRSSEEKFADCLCGGVGMDEWLMKTKQSLLVFNTPAFWNCHGWKLGEYLAMGKCIVSTPLTNDLPEPLVHGVNVHFVDNDQSAIKEAVDYIVKHPEYRKKLESGAKEYWLRFGTPEQSLRLLGIQ